MSALALCGRPRNLLFLSRPALWPAWPFLPVVRRRPGQEEELGLMYDCFSVAGRTGLSATVYLGNLFELPPTEDELLAMPHETYDNADEVYAAGWRID